MSITRNTVLTDSATNGEVNSARAWEKRDEDMWGAEVKFYVL
jgi:hypothetical protein